MVEILGEIIAAIGEAIFSWRFYLCFGLAVVVIASICWFVPPSPGRAILSAAAGAVALGVAIVWESRAS